MTGRVHPVFGVTLLVILLSTLLIGDFSEKVATLTSILGLLGGVVTVWALFPARRNWQALVVGAVVGSMTGRLLAGPFAGMMAPGGLVGYAIGRGLVDGIIGGLGIASLLRGGEHSGDAVPNNDQASVKLRTAKDIALEQARRPDVKVADIPTNQRESKGHSTIRDAKEMMARLGRSPRFWIVLAVAFVLAFVANATRYETRDGPLVWDRWGHRICTVSLRGMKCGKAWWD